MAARSEMPRPIRGVLAPDLKRKAEPKWGKPTSLFNGKDLSGWRPSDPNATATWKVENGTLVSPGHGPELITDAKFENFKLHVEFNCAPKSNSGIYLRGRYEVQIEDDPVPEGPTMRTGGVYGFLAASPEQPRRPGEWQTYDITLVGRVVTVVQNGQTIIDREEIPGITGGALLFGAAQDVQEDFVVTWSVTHRIVETPEFVACPKQKEYSIERGE